ncbi:MULTISPECIES: hypothetical protein [unclassified Clostridium]|uniref:hypothetical protein n=1 Tax=unclassified Clostridium TaxID=2614128 RepID=UPI0025C20E66|nr:MULTISPECIES: hypothetical protein [unclassified Clostridium]
MVNYISKEMFLEQSEKVQDELLNWWKPTIGDLYCCTNNGVLKVIDCDTFSEYEIQGSLKETIHCYNSIYDRIIPLCQMHQLVYFIENKTTCRVDMTYYDEIGYDIFLLKHGEIAYHYEDLGQDMLMALWQVACKVAEVL